MANNLPNRHDSSGSDDEHGYIGPRVTETHYHSGCRYNKFKTSLGGRVLYVWLRSCFCGQYSSYDIREGVTNLRPEDGKDIHYSAECRWRKVRKDGAWELSKKCRNCGAPQTASYTGNTSGMCSPS